VKEKGKRGREKEIYRGGRNEDICNRSWRTTGA